MFATQYLNSTVVALYGYNPNFTILIQENKVNETNP